MKNPKKNMTHILGLLLSVAVVMLFMMKYNKDALQKGIDLNFINAVSDSMGGLSKDYSKIDSDEKIRNYYQTVTNLKDALDVFHITSYKDYDEYFEILNRLYIYLLENKNDNYEIKGQSHIFEFLGKSLVYPDDSQVISDFNTYLDEKAKEKENFAAKKTIDLTFAPVPREVLKEGIPDEGWTKAKSIYFGNLENQVESTLHLYIDNEGNADLRPGEGIIYGFIEHSGRFFEIGIVSYYGIDNVDVNLADRNYDGIKEIEIVGDMGATYIEMKIISYNESNRQWENLLTMGSPEIIDLDNDGRDELIAVSAGSLPTFVDIYKWNNDCFEKADISEATESDFASLYISKDEWIIETGIIVDGKVPGTALYKYKDGKLLLK
mgnify:FL=1|jgi:hypothetical protein